MITVAYGGRRAKILVSVGAQNGWKWCSQDYRAEQGLRSDRGRKGNAGASTGPTQIGSEPSTQADAVLVQQKA